MFGPSEFVPLLPKRLGSSPRSRQDMDKVIHRCNQELDNCWQLLWIRWLHLLVVYSGLALFFAFYMYVLFYFTILADLPRRTGESSLLSLNPGLAMVPAATTKTTLIQIRLSDPRSFNALVDQMTAFLSHYHFQLIGGMFSDCSKTGYSLNTRRPCRFDLDVAGPCNLKNGYGYHDGQPCFALKLNRIYGWLPDPVGNASGVQVRCEGLSETDSEFLGRVCYYDTETYRLYGETGIERPFCESGSGLFHKMFYPFLNQGKYQAPLVFVQFMNPKRHAVIFVKCYAIAKNIQVDVAQNEGSMVFQLLIE